MSILVDSYELHDSSAGLRSGYARGQSFTPSVSFTLESVAIKGLKVGSPPSYTFNLYLGSDGLPTGGVLSSVTFVGTEFPANPTTGWQKKNLSTPYNLVAGTQYVLHCPSCGGNISNFANWLLKIAGSYSGGCFEDGTVTAYDATFRLYKASPPISIGQSAISRVNNMSSVNDTILQPLVTTTLKGVIDTVRVYVTQINHAGLTLKAGIFYPTTGLKFKCRSAAGLGVPALGLNEWPGLSLTCEDGDMIGYYWSDGTYGGGLLAVSGPGEGTDMYSTIAVDACTAGLESQFYALNWPYVASFGGTGLGDIDPRSPCKLYLGGTLPSKNMSRMRGW